MHSTAGNVWREAFQLLIGSALALAFSLLAAYAQTGEPIKIGVIGEQSAVAGASITKAAAMAADDINARGGVSGRRIEAITMTIIPQRPMRCAPSSAQ